MHKSQFVYTKVLFSGTSVQLYNTLTRIPWLLPMWLHDLTARWQQTLYKPLASNTFCRFSFYTEGIRNSFQAKGWLSRVEGTLFYSKISQISGQLEATGHGKSIKIQQLSDLAGFPVYQYPLPIQLALK